ncbi:DUF4148 domain-containing protein [Ramlibacter sp. AW1]|uniref:DUF4148 domain-containing protein n=1 Tax=Ramlibacter aurantiacus TaxID=2801330 RepID=A0A936ZI02_9BURK|nr:DUF4148 domain-containing protein [Ramlibacter aurantiacus]MBL0420583.1 DUF4148 domain-containing protein [Ramlibacter aurantiacus]
MNLKPARIALLAAVALTGAAAFADALPSEYQENAVSTKSRAEVRAELAQFRQSGVNPWSTSFNQLRGVQSTRTRAEVAQDYLDNREAAAAFTSEDSGSAYLAQHRASDATRTLASN